MVGLIEDVRKSMTQWFKHEGDAIYLLGDPAGASLAASEYLSVVHGVEAGRPAAVDLKKEKALHDALRAAIGVGVVASAHDCSEGGLAAALAECCITNPAGAIGARITLEGGGRADTLLFGEGPSRIIVSTSAENASPLEAILRAADVPFRRLGEVGGPSIEMRLSGNALSLNAAGLRRAWQTALPELLNR
jgi:phosphoribosylformylglycinamidine synthase